MKRKAHGAQEPRHIQKYVEVTSTAQRSDSPAQVINQRFFKDWRFYGEVVKALLVPLNPLLSWQES